MAAEVIAGDEPRVLGTTLMQSDRCDRCPAQAQVRWVAGEQFVDTCAHHARVHREALEAWADWVVDQRDREGWSQ